MSLFSALVAAHANETGLDHLTITSERFADFDLTDPATVLYLLKLSTYPDSSSYYQSLQRRDLERRPEAHISKLRASLDDLKAGIAGFHYESRDLFDHAESAMSDPGTVLWLNPPGFKRGYEKMYDTHGAISWAEPDYEEFNPGTGHARLHTSTLHSPALALRYTSHITSEDSGHTVFAVEHGSSTAFIFANRMEEVAKFAPSVSINRRIGVKPLSLPLLPEDHEITPDSDIQFIVAAERNALYYRDLWAHRLGVTTSERHFIMVVDGYVAGVCGFMTSPLKRGMMNADGERTAEETYGFTAQSNRYARLNRLLMMLICTKGFLDSLAVNIYSPTALTTTCLSEHKELKTNRGILGLYHRERMPNGMYYLRYIAHAKHKTFQETIEEWLRKHGKHSRGTPD
jgi:hypothetical protein